MNAPIDSGDKYITLKNNGGIDNLKNDPVRSEYSFEAEEMIYALPQMDGDYHLYIEGHSRTPDLEVDIFILTDPQDASSAILWMNGTGAKALLQAKSDERYYAVVDGFKNITAELKFAVVPAPALPTFCNTQSQIIDLNTYLTMGPSVLGDSWARINGTGGSLDMISGIFTSIPGTTTSTFQLKRNNATPPIATTEDVTIVFQHCNLVPTMSQWGLVSLSLVLMIVGVVALGFGKRMTY